MSEGTERTVVRFFAQYEARVNRALREEPVDVEATAAAFTSCFLAASPAGVACNENDEQFRAEIPKGFDFYRSIGAASMRISSLAVTDLDEFHAMARVRWRSLYRKSDTPEICIDFDVIYMLHIRDAAEPRIFAYITTDESKALRDHGLIAA